MQNPVSEILKTFDPISLQEMDNVKLMDRTDTKFTFNIRELPAVLQEAKSDYKILEV